LLPSIRRHLHQRPELGFEEHETAAYISEVLAMHGLEAQEIAGTGRFVDIRGGRPGPTVGYRADIDALPIQDAKDVPYASQRAGRAHLCGHDAHTAVGIGVALRVAEQRARLRGTVRVFFQPNEEGLPSGAPHMIEGGVLEGLSAAYAIHVDPTIQAGCYGVRSGAVTAAADKFDVTVRAGSTGHSARPHESTDTVWIATQIANSFYQVAGRLTDARDPQVITICRFEGGEAYNVIPEVARFGGTIRSTDEVARKRLKETLKRMGEHVGGAYGADVSVDYGGGAPAVINDANIAKHVARVVRSERGDEQVYVIPKPSMGSEDFAHYLQHVPGMLVRVGTCSGPATSYPLHDAHFDLDEATLAPTADLMAEVLLGHASTFGS
jgi:amidohydrolase